MHLTPHGCTPTERSAYSGPQPRPVTSMADFHPINEGVSPSNIAPPGLHTYGGMSSRQTLYTPFSTAPQDGAMACRIDADEQVAEHLRLMDELLTMFEALPLCLLSMGDTGLSEYAKNRHYCFVNVWIKNIILLITTRALAITMLLCASLKSACNP